MTTIEIIALSAVGVWLLVLSVVALLIVRQMSLMTIRLSTAAPHSVADEHGPRVGTPVPSEILELLNQPVQPVVLAFATGTCDPCREFAEGLLPNHDYPGTKFVILGPPSQTTEVTGAIPPGADVIPDPVAEEVARRLGVDLMPFGVRINNGMVEATTHLRSNEDLARISGAEDEPALDVVLAGDRS